MPLEVKLRVGNTVRTHKRILPNFPHIIRKISLQQATPMRFLIVNPRCVVFFYKNLSNLTALTAFAMNHLFRYFCDKHLIIDRLRPL